MVKFEKNTFQKSTKDAEGNTIGIKNASLINQVFVFKQESKKEENTYANNTNSGTAVSVKINVFFIARIKYLLDKTLKKFSNPTNFVPIVEFITA